MKMKITKITLSYILLTHMLSNKQDQFSTKNNTNI
jgi:hypothetical protein